MTAHRRLRALVAALVVAAGVGAMPTPAEAAACPAGSGVTVVLDPGSLGGSVASVCEAGGGGKVAWDLFETAGFSLTGVQKFPGFVCRVDGRPADDACVNTPPADAYWGLFWSRGNGSWIYSSSGATSLEVPGGDFVALAWQDGGTRDLPGVAPTPPAPPSPSPTKKPEPTPKPKPDPEPGAGASATSPAPGSPSAASPSGSRGEGTGAGAAEDRSAEPGGGPSDGSSAGPGEGPSDGPGDGPPDQPTERPSASAETSDGGPASAESIPEVTSTSAAADSGGGAGRWVPIAVIVVLLGAAGVLILRRRAP